ncbi:hypothetical protein KDW75_gp61 [Mycobacterium phage Mercurio]|uniref:Uncharacterized protein n=1 Tax=Mycobacterium phage Mercurio TaxID=2575612 RepID=A0A5J6T6P0_9CAUD|nr:hypothetical protein KDW75_gp61 [Mycobacterium phage Mercurio]QFG06066.1 hypothetical protein PBI_MERCURIO_61 [Mycobacterium phage Mercurio]
MSGYLPPETQNGPEPKFEPVRAGVSPQTARSHPCAMYLHRNTQVRPLPGRITAVRWWVSLMPARSPAFDRSGRDAYLEGVPDVATRCRPHRCRVPLRTFRPRGPSNSRTCCTRTPSDVPTTRS